MKKLCPGQAFLLITTVIFNVTFFSCVSTKQPNEEIQQVQPKPEQQQEVKEEVPFNVRFVQELQTLLNQDKIAEAIDLFQTMPPEYQKDVDLLLIKASLLISANRLEEATALTDQLLLLAPENKDVLELAAMLAKASGNSQKKNETIKQLLATDPNHPGANVELGNEQMLKKNFNQAKTYYEKGLKGDPNNVDALTGYGQSLYYLEDDKAAANAFNKAIENDPRNSFAYSYLGKLAAADENYLVATQNIEKAIEINPDVFDYWMDYGQYLRNRGKYKEAENAWKKAKDLEPEYFLSYAFLAGLYDEQNRFHEALEMYRKVIELNPKYYFAYESLGMLAWHEGNYSEARVAFEKAFAANKDNISYPLLIAASYLKENNTADCRTFLSKQLRNRNTSSVEYSMLRLYYDRINDMQVSQKVQNTSNRNLKGKMLYYLGLFYEINGNDVLAKKYYTDVISLNSPMFFEFRLAEWAVQQPEK